MTGNIVCLRKFVESYVGSVTFNNVKKGKIRGKKTLIVEGMPNLKDVFYVDDLKANLVSINQLCDQGMLVNFTKDKCVVSLKQNEKVM